MILKIENMGTRRLVTSNKSHLDNSYSTPTRTLLMRPSLLQYTSARD